MQPFYEKTGKAVKWQWKNKVVPFWKDMAKRIEGTDIRFAFEIYLRDYVYNCVLFLKLKEEVGSEKIICNLKILLIERG